MEQGEVEEGGGGRGLLGLKVRHGPFKGLEMRMHEAHHY